MALPFLQPKKLASVIVAKRKSDGSLDPQGPEDEQDHALLTAAEDLLAAVASKDAGRVAEALKAAFDICDSLPHVEGEHVDAAEELE